MTQHRLVWKGKTLHKLDQLNEIICNHLLAISLLAAGDASSLLTGWHHCMSIIRGS